MIIAVVLVLLYLIGTFIAAFLVTRLVHNKLVDSTFFDLVLWTRRFLFERPLGELRLPYIFPSVLQSRMVSQAFTRCLDPLKHIGDVELKDLLSTSARKMPRSSVRRRSENLDTSSYSTYNIKSDLPCCSDFEAKSWQKQLRPIPMMTGISTSIKTFERPNYRSRRCRWLHKG